MKPTECMTWAGPLPETAAVEPVERVTMTFAGPLEADWTDPAPIQASGEVTFWAGPLPPTRRVAQRAVNFPIPRETASIR